MKIQVGKYIIESDRFCYWILEEQPVTEKAKKSNVRYERVGGYSTTLDNLLRSFCENKVKMSDATDMEELIADLAQIVKDMKELNEAAVAHGLDKIRSKYGKE